MRKISYPMVLAAALVFLSGPTHAWDGILDGVIGAVEAVSISPDSMDFRVHMTGSGRCNGRNWAYINLSAPNYHAVVATLLSAKTTKSSIYIYATRDSAGYCYIGDVSVYS